jgi:hypothetical protein
MSRFSGNGGLALAIATLLLTLTACSSVSEPTERPQTARQAREAMQSFVRATMKTSGVAWKSENGDPSPDECTLADGSSGVSFSWNHNAEGVDDPEVLVKKVGSSWKQQGYEVTYQQGAMNPDGTLYQVIGEGAAAHSISVNASKYRVSIGVDSRCGTGDIDKYYEQRIDPSPSAP